jgi:hypothetical protein
MTHRIFLIPGFFGFANLGGIAYFGHVRDVLGRACAALGLDATTHVVRTAPTSSLPRRATTLLRAIAKTPIGDDDPIHLIGHSSGAVDARLFVSPGAALTAQSDAERVARRVRTLVSVAAPHHGTPVASFFTSLLGQRLLQALSLVTIYVLRFGHVPVSVMLRLGATFARLDHHLGVNSALLDQLFGQLLADFSADRRRALGRLLDEVRADQALLIQLGPEGMDVFNALARDRPGVRYGCVVTRGRRPGPTSALAAGFDPSAQATHVLYQALYRLVARTATAPRVRPTPSQAAALRQAYGSLPGPDANDGVVPTLSQLWGEVLYAARADHLDVLGHYDDPDRLPPHFDWLTTVSGFDRESFLDLWEAVARHLAGAPDVTAQRPRSRTALRGRKRGRPVRRNRVDPRGASPD